MHHPPRPAREPRRRARRLMLLLRGLPGRRVPPTATASAGAARAWSGWRSSPPAARGWPPSIEALRRRATELGGADVLPLTLDPERGRARRSVGSRFGWGGVGGLAVAIEPLVGGAVVQVPAVELLAKRADRPCPDPARPEAGEPARRRRSTCRAWASPAPASWRRHLAGAGAGTRSARRAPRSSSRSWEWVVLAL